MPLITAAIAGVSRTGQEVLARASDRRVREALSSAPGTCVSVLDRLVDDRDPQVRRHALTRTSNVDALTKALAPGRRGLLAAAAASNPLASPEDLARAARSADRAVQLAARCNPATPVDVREDLDPETATSLVSVGGSLADRVIRAHRLVLSNPWMLAFPGKWDGLVRRAFAASMDLTVDHVKIILAVGSHGRRDLASHPACRPCDFVDPVKRIEAGSPAVDLALMADPSTDFTVAAALLRRTEPEPEPIVIASAVRRFGPQVVVGSQDESPTLRWSNSRYDAAMWLEPVLGFVKFGDETAIPGMLEASSLLGEQSAAWETFFSLLPSWHQSAVEAASAALSV